MKEHFDNLNPKSEIEINLLQSGALIKGEKNVEFEPSEQEKLKNERYKSDTFDRKWLAIWAAAIVSLWLAAVLFLLFFNTHIKTSDTVMVALLGTTTLNVLGLTYIVLKGHFEEKTHK